MSTTKSPTPGTPDLTPETAGSPGPRLTLGHRCTGGHPLQGGGKRRDTVRPTCQVSEPFAIGHPGSSPPLFPSGGSTRTPLGSTTRPRPSLRVHVCGHFIPVDRPEELDEVSKNKRPVKWTSSGSTDIGDPRERHLYYGQESGRDPDRDTSRGSTHTYIYTCVHLHTSVVLHTRDDNPSNGTPTSLGSGLSSLPLCSGLRHRKIPQSATEALDRSEVLMDPKDRHV